MTYHGTNRVESRRLAWICSIIAMIVGFLSASADAQQTAPPGHEAPTARSGPYPFPPGFQDQRFDEQTAEQAFAKSAGCIQCHQNTGDPHFKDSVKLGCVDCHGGNPATNIKEAAHVAPLYPDAWPTAANPVRSYTLLNRESSEFVRFVNPGDLRVAHMSCGTMGCHAPEVLQNRKSMMSHGCMLWGSALYNNGAYPEKWAKFGEAYAMEGAPLRLQTVPPPTEYETATKGVLPYLDPLPRFEVSQPGNVLRIFEQGRTPPPELGIPNILEDPGRPKVGLSARGFGTKNRTDPVFIGLNKTRLLDPTTNFLGTNDQPGDYRSSGCSACHVIYANDRSPVTAGPFAKYGNRGTTINPDPTIPKDEPGHPIEHRFTSGIPTSQCIVCHTHPGTTVMNSYTGYMWWDEESDGDLIWPEEQRHPTAEQSILSQMRNPNEIDSKNRLAEPQFLADLAAFANPRATKTQFADFHGHGWAYKAAFMKDRRGELLDYNGRGIGEPTPQALQTAMIPPSQEERVEGKRREETPVHLMDIHLEKGMHCVDCHFVQDMHGNTKLYGEVRAAIEIQCIDCHGTSTKPTTLLTSGPASDTSGTPDRPGRNLATMRTPFGKRRFERKGDKIVQNSMVEEDLWWEVVQTADTINPESNHFNERSRLAKTVRFAPDGGLVYGDVPGGDGSKCAHADEEMSCIACHSSWNPSCFGCHLPQKANRKMPQLHNEGDVTRNYTAYNWQTLRDDVFMLGRDGDVTGNRINPARSSCAIHVSSFNQNREQIYVLQQTISAEGLSGIAFSTNVPHTVRGGTPEKIDGLPASHEAMLPGHSQTKSCTDCHLSRTDDNNAIMAQLLMQGTNFTNFIGRFAWVAAGEEGVTAVEVSEFEEPQAVIGSDMHRMAFPDNYREHLEAGGILEHAHEHPGVDVSDQLFHPRRARETEVLDVQPRGEYVYTACGAGGLKILDIAFIDHKGFSERIVSAPVSPLGQRFFVKTTYATAVAAPTTVAPDPTRTHRPENREQSVHPVYGYIYVADRYEGLVMVGAATLLDGNPLNNFVHKDVVYNPGGLLRGARSISIIGTSAYIGCDAGLVVVDLDDPTKPKVSAILGPEVVGRPNSIQAQFRYAFVCDEEGVRTLDITDVAHPRAVGFLPLPGAEKMYVARTYAYVAAGEQGLVILDVENPERPRVDQVYDAGGRINDLHDVKLGITYASEFAYLADGRNGLRVVQLTSTETPGYQGFSPRPTPRLISTFPIPKGGEALAVGEGIDRDRAVDEAGNQIGVFGRVGARPMNLEEQRRLYLKDGRIWKVSDDPRDPIYRLAPGAKPGPWMQRGDTAPAPPSLDPPAITGGPATDPGVRRAGVKTPE